MRLRLAILLGLGLGAAAVSGTAADSAAGAVEPATELVALPIHLPIPIIASKPTDLAPSVHIERPSGWPRPPFLAPQGSTNLALHKPVTASSRTLIRGELGKICDGEKEFDYDASRRIHRVELPAGVQWVQIDLGNPRQIWAICVWHEQDLSRLVHGVIVQIADDAAFSRNVRTLFNNDYEGKAGVGLGTDKEYFETYEGRLVPAKGECARFVRCYSRGNTDFQNNVWTEIEVWGLPQVGKTTQTALSPSR